MRAWLRWSIHGFTAICLGLLTHPARAALFEIMVPAYFQPTLSGAGAVTGDWSLLTGAAQAGQRVTAILNPNSGPGVLPPPTNWATAAQAFVCDRCESLLGFVSTRYGDRPIAEVKAEIDAYYQWYPVTGIFLDELPSEADMLDVDANQQLIRSPLWDPRMAYYRELYTYIKNKAAADRVRVVGNPGTRTVEEFLTGEAGVGGPVADTLIVFENSPDLLLPAGGSGQYVPTPWNTAPGTSYRDQLGYIVHSSAPSQLADLLTRIDGLGAGIAYITDGSFVPALPSGTDDQRYTQLPSYWDALIAQAEFCPVPVAASGPLMGLGLMVMALGRRRRRRA